MAYLTTQQHGSRARKRYRRGGVSSVSLGALGGIGDALSAALGVAQDPYLSEVICHVEQLESIKSGKPAQACQEVPYGAPGGVGLDKVAVAMRGYVYAEENPWVYPLAALVVIGLPMWIGYQLGTTE